MFQENKVYEVRRGNYDRWFIMLDADTLYCLAQGFGVWVPANAAEFLEQYAKKTALRKRRSYPIRDIQLLEFEAYEPEDLFMNISGKKWSARFAKGELLKFVEELSSQLRLKKQVRKMTFFQAARFWIFATFFVAPFLVFLYWSAWKLQQGDTLDLRAPAWNMRGWMARMADSIGVKGVLMVSGVILLLIMLGIYMRAKVRPEMVRYENVPDQFI